MRIFGSDRIAGLMQRLGMEEGVPIEHGMVTRAIERAQKQVEAQNFSVRKHLLEYDDVMNKQRESVYTLRREILKGPSTSPRTRSSTPASTTWRSPRNSRRPRRTLRRKDLDVEEWISLARARGVARVSGSIPRSSKHSISTRRTPTRSRRYLGARQGELRQEGADARSELLRRIERDIMLQIVDVQWKDHLYSLDHLKEGIGLRGYGQRDPLVEYKRKATRSSRI